MDLATSTVFCDSSTTLKSFVYNLTTFYAEADLRGDEALLVGTSVLMFVLAVLFFILNLFSGFSDGSAILNPSVRVFLSTSLSLFLPIMSYLFSEAKNQSAAGHLGDLSVRARTILMWMLLVELLRKKAEAILLTTGTQVYSDTIDRAGRVAWLGSLVFFNLRSTGKKALYGTIWVLAAAKLVQRFVTIELAKRSFAYRKNPRLVASYMAQMLKLQGQETQQRTSSSNGSEVLRWCNYAVMGEEGLEMKAGPKGYKLQLADNKATADAVVVTVGKIWKLADTDPLLRGDPRLRRLCLSFALYKLLRRRLEGFPISDAEASNCHDLVFEGVQKEEGTGGGEDANNATALIQVFNDQVQFLCEYYHSVHPVVLASPFFFVHNYIVFPIIVWALCFFMLILCSNGDVRYAFQSFRTDNYVMSGHLLKMARCILRKAVSKSTPFLFCSVDVSTTILLILTFAYEEVWDLIVFLLSNWFMVSLLCRHTSSPEWRTHPLLRWIIPGIVSVRNTMTSHCSNVSFKQFSVLWFSLPLLPLPLPTVAAVPDEAKKLVVARLATVRHAAPLSNSMSFALQSDEDRGLSWACESDGVAEVILTWHIATSLLEAGCPRQKHAQPEPGRMAATALSGYCAYLVAYRPGLLPDDKDGSESLYNDMKKELVEEMGWWGYYSSGEADRRWKVMEIARRRRVQDGTTTTVISKGARLGKALIDRCKDGTPESVWKLLGDLWTEVVVYAAAAAPTSGELHMQAHKEALAEGGEFITTLWAMATHTGIACAGPAEPPVEVPLPRSVSSV
ncbi:unnamed protein product [Urochloa decumbens]|uniref:DUF4220 domain-containing protein n=1 Tax=Urochloa decumbens TaxID=240449 RepID=A0ABC9D9G2_9POAL